MRFNSATHSKGARVCAGSPRGFNSRRGVPILHPERRVVDGPRMRTSGFSLAAIKSNRDGCIAFRAIGKLQDAGKPETPHGSTPCPREQAG